jgi:hypothetical protein
MLKPPFGTARHDGALVPLVDIGQVFTGWKASFNYDAGSSAVTALVLASQRQTYTFTLTTALPLDATLIRTDVNPPRLKHWDELTGAAIDLSGRFSPG